MALKGGHNHEKTNCTANVNSDVILHNTDCKYNN